MTAPVNRASVTRVSCIGFQEGLIILAVVVVVMGSSRIPQLGDALGRSIVNFKRAINGRDEIDVTPEEDKKIAAGEDDGSKSA